MLEEWRIGTGEGWIRSGAEPAWAETGGEGMAKGKTAAGAGRRGTISDSFLVRIWREPREDRTASQPVRGFVRNLRTGEEHYLGDPGLVLDQLVRSSESKEETLAPRREADAG